MSDTAITVVGVVLALGATIYLCYWIGAKHSREMLEIADEWVRAGDSHADCGRLPDARRCWERADRLRQRYGWARRSA